MRKLILALLILTAGVSFAQVSGEPFYRGKTIGGGTVWSDTLSYTTAAVPSDSVIVFNVNFSHDWYRFFIKGNANSPVDSFYVQHGSINYDIGGTAIDTSWGSWSMVKDSVWGDINTMINNTVGKDFLLFSPVAQLLRFTLLNDRATLATRSLRLSISAVKY